MSPPQTPGEGGGVERRLLCQGPSFWPFFFTNIGNLFSSKRGQMTFFLTPINMLIPMPFAFSFGFWSLLA